jgi:hypothetical protein
LEENRNAYEVWIGKFDGKNYLENLSFDGRIILEWILKKLDGIMWTEVTWKKIGASRWLLVHDNEPYRSIKYWESRNKLSNN